MTAKNSFLANKVHAKIDCEGFNDGVLAPIPVHCMVRTTTHGCGRKDWQTPLMALGPWETVHYPAASDDENTAQKVMTFTL